MYAHTIHRYNTAKTERSATIPGDLSTSDSKKQTGISTLTPCTSTRTCIAPPPNHWHTEASNIHICCICHDTYGKHNHQLQTNPIQLARCSFLPFLVCISRCLCTTALSLGHNWGARSKKAESLTTGLFGIWHVTSSFPAGAEPKPCNHKKKKNYRQEKTRIWPEDCKKLPMLRSHNR